MDFVRTAILQDRGQLTLPSDIRTEMKLKTGTELIIFKTEDKIVIKPKIKDPIKMAGFLGKETKYKNFKEILLEYL